MTAARSGLSATVLADGTVLLAGGTNGFVALATAEAVLARRFSHAVRRTAVSPRHDVPRVAAEVVPDLLQMLSRNTYAQK